MMTIKTENWLGEFVSTIGTGDAILGGAIDGFAGFSNVGDDVDVYYTIIDGLDKETGIGTLTGGKLVRKDIHATLVDGAYVKNGSAIKLSGDAQVYGTANAHFIDYVQAVVNAEIVNTQAIAELKALQINGHALTASFNLTAADVGAHPDSWMPSTEALNVYQKDASDIRYLKTQDAEQVAGLVMRVGGAREQQLQQSIDGLESRIDEALRRSYAESGFNVVGTFQAGFTYVNVNDVGIDETTGKGYTGPAGVVAAGTSPVGGGFVDKSAAIRVTVTYAGIRSYSGSSVELRCIGRENIFDHGFGDFVRDDSGATSPDNDGTVLIDALGRRWKRLFIGAADVRWWGAAGDGVKDCTQAFDNACAALAASSVKETLFVPNGRHIYNGAGINLPTSASLEGESMLAVIDASANTNSGYLVTINGFRGRVNKIDLRGNYSNPNMKGISSYYNSDDGGVTNCILQDFTYGLDIDKAWYSVYENIRFRHTIGIAFSGACIRIGYNHPTLEVNNINFRNIWMGEDQKHCVAVYGRTQNLSWTCCSFENTGGPRIKFYTAADQNTFAIYGSYIEGDCGPDGTYFVEGQSKAQQVSVYDCMFRLGPTAGVLAKNATIVFGSGNWSNSPNVSMAGSGAAIISDSSSNLPFFQGNLNPYKGTGLWSGSELNADTVQVGPRTQPIFEANSLIGPYVNFKRHPDTSPVAIFKAFMPASTSSFARIMMLEISAATKGTDENYIQGLEKYMLTITLPEGGTVGAGVHVAKILSSARYNAALLADPAITVVSNGYDATTDSTVYTIYHQVSNPTRLGDTVFTLTGCYMDNGLSSLTRGWKIQRM